MTAARLACALALTAGVAAAQEPPRLDLHGDPLPPGAVARLGTVRFRHPGPVGGYAFSPDGTRIAASSGGDQRMVVVWDRATGKKVRDLPGSSGRVAFSADGKRVYVNSGGRDPELQAWDPTTREPAEHVRVPAGAWLLAFPQRGTEFLFAQNYRDLIRWDIAKGEELGRGLLPFRGPLMTRIGDRLIAANYDDGVVRVYDVTRDVELWKIPALRMKNYGVPAPAFSADGTLVAVSPKPLTVDVYETLTGRVERVLEADGDKPYWSLAISPDKRTLAGNNRDGSVRLWNLADGRERARVRVIPGKITGVTFAPDSKTFATAGENSAHGVMLWDTATGRPVEPYPSHAAPVSSVAFAPDGRLVATSSMRGDPVVRLWEPTTGKLVRALDSGVPDGVSAVAFSPDGRTLAACSGYEDRKVRIWDVSTGAVRHVMGGHTGGCLCVAFSPDGKWVASGDTSENRPRSDRSVVRVWDAATGSLVREIGGHGELMDRVHFSRDGKQLLVVARGLYVYDLATGRRVGEAMYPRDVVKDVSPDGTLLVTSGEGGVLLREVATNRVRPWGTPPGYGNRATFSPDGRMLALRRNTGEAVVVRVSSGERVATFEGTPASWAHTFSPDGRRLATSVYAESSVLLWDVSGGER